MDYTLSDAEIEELKAVCGDKHLKVILETGALGNASNIKKASILSMYSGADFIKTSTGFGTGGATVEDVKLMKSIVKDTVKVKAAGGIRDLDTCLKMIEAGAERIGTSSAIKITEAYNNK